MHFEIDDSELRTLARDLSGAPLRVQFNAKKVLRRGAEIIDAQMRIDASGHRYLSNLPAAVSHEIIGPYTAEIGLGPNHDQGSIAHIIAYGSVNNAPVYDHTAGLRRSTPEITELFAAAAEDSVLEVPVRAVDDILMPLIEAAVVNLDDGYVKSDNKNKIVTFPIPYAVFMSSIGDDDNRRLSGRKGRRSVFFSLKFVGVSREQVKWIGEKARGVLADQRIAVPGHRTWPCQLLASTRVFRDDDAINPDGSPLFYAVDDYALSITQTHGSTP